MRCSWIEKTRSRKKVDWEHTKRCRQSLLKQFDSHVHEWREVQAWCRRPSGEACHDCCCFCCRRHVVERSGLAAGSIYTHERSDPPSHTCRRPQRQCGDPGCSVELG